MTPSCLYTRPARMVIRDFMYWLIRLRGHQMSREGFELDGIRYPYFYHYYNSTWGNERCVEVPFALRLLAENEGRRILEVGNVLAHYTRHHHLVVDKYERRRQRDLLCLDIEEYRTVQPFDLILALSTIEHIGWDEEEKDPAKVVRVVAQLRSLLSPDGLLVATFPVGQNPWLDLAVRRGDIVFDRFLCMRRTAARNGWREVPPDTVWDTRYGFPYPCANGLVIALANG